MNEVEMKAAKLQAWKQHFEELVMDAECYGVIVTISQVPAEPLAMGNYTTVVEVRAKK